MIDFVSFPSSSLTPEEAYNLVASAIVPRPIAFVSTLSPVGVANLAPFSFFMAGGANPPSLAISINKGAGGRRKDTLQNIESTGEFVVNLVNRAMAEGVNAASQGLPPDISEWPFADFNPVPSHLISPPRVLESPIQFECRRFHIVDHGDGPGSAVYVIGEIVAIHVASHCMGDGVVTGFEPISRLGGPSYLNLENGERFEMIRPI